MKTSIYLLAVLGSCLALPSPPLAWEDIKGENVYIEPIANYTSDAQTGGRVIGGSEVTPNSRPYQVALFINGRSFCGGSLISQNFVLSAAHCTTSASYTDLLFGAHNVQSQESTQLRVTSTSVVNHPQYQPQTLSNDVSLISIPSPIVSNEYIQRIPLAPASAGDYTGSSAYIIGWGRISDSSSGISPVPQEVQVEVISNTVCSRTYSVIQSSTICTSGEGVVGACNGDSGGPLVANGVQIGIASFVSARGCQSGLPTGFAS
ncbi:hypothetical protein NQ315_014585 [Exocentrus adspersus]|uniref:Peptidase S1 domain-containing protein n=1 Tax=Exocentrus adspersus TaxID=1586481 RepID=A0AAV8VEX0_9CUCU|nr:hypothetical protein NQ315_014585 [Exocentrus adspersus]